MRSTIAPQFNVEKVSLRDGALRTRLRGLIVGFVCAATWLLTHSATAQDEKREYKVGDKIMVLERGEFVEKEIVEIDGPWLYYMSEFAGRETKSWTTARQIESVQRMWNTRRGNSRRGTRGETSGGATTRTVSPPKFEMRKWTSADGNYHVQAKLKSLADKSSMVTLVKTDNEEIEVSKEQLSDEDLAYLGSMAQKHAAPRPAGRGFGGRGRMGARRNWPGDRHGRGDNSAIENSGNSETGGYEVTTIDGGNPSNYSLLQGWKPRIPDTLPRNLPNVAIPFQIDSSRMNFTPGWESTIVVSTDGRFAAVGMNEWVAGNDTSRLIVFDLQTGAIAAQADFAAKSHPLAFTKDGRELMASHNFGGWGDNLHYWRISEESKTLVFMKGWALPKTALFGTFVDEKHFAAMDKSFATTYNLETGKAVKQSDHASAPLQVAGANNLALYDGSSAKKGIIDLTRGAGYMFSENRDHSLFGPRAISPDGRLVAVCHEAVTRVFDMSNGELVSEFGNASSTFFPCFATNEYLLVGKYLFDVQSGVVLAQLELPRVSGSYHRLVSTVDGSLIIVLPVDEPRGEWALVVRRLFTDDLLRQIDQNKSTQLYDIASGTRVRLNAVGLPHNIDAAVRKTIREAGFTLDNSSNIVLHAEVETLPRETKTYNKGKEDEVTVTFTPTKSKCKLLVEGHEVWGFARLNHPGPIATRNRGESPQGAANRWSSPDPDHFSGVVIPVNLRVRAAELPVIQWDVGNEE